MSAAEAAAESLSAADRGALLGLCSGLGAPRQVAGVGLRYVKEEDTQECLESLISYLRRDDPTRAVVLQLADWNTARGHVVPLLVAYAHSFELLFAATKARPGDVRAGSAAFPPPLSSCGPPRPVPVRWLCS